MKEGMRKQDDDVSKGMPDDVESRCRTPPKVAGMFKKFAQIDPCRMQSVASGKLFFERGTVPARDAERRCGCRRGTTSMSACRDVAMRNSALLPMFFYIGFFIEGACVVPRVW